MMKILDKIFGSGEKKLQKKLQPIVDEINAFEPEISKLSDSELRAKTDEFRKKIKEEANKHKDKEAELLEQRKKSANESDKERNKIVREYLRATNEKFETILPEAFAVVREAAKRVLKQRHFDVQLMGGIVLHQGRIAEMKTGEGKTLVATLAMYLNALEGKGAHLVTVNDYLARRDANWMGPIYHFLGLSIGCVQHDKSFLFDPAVLPDENEVTVEMENLREVSRKEAYAADITYGTNNEFGFDYLRDNMAGNLEQTSQRDFNFVIVDEVDSILIDEARTPLIISAPDEESIPMYKQFARMIGQLQKDADYTLDEQMKAVMITDEGISKVEKMLGIQDFYADQVESINRAHQLEQALKAKEYFIRDKNYVVKEGQVIIVDDFTGRLMPGRRYSEGLHQAIEAKEGVDVQKESRTLATITFQNYFRMYDKLSGMTGTAITSSEEFSRVYDLDVEIIPTNKILIRQDLNDTIYKTEMGKYIALAREVRKRHEKGQPVLIGTISIEKSELISAILQKEGVPHEILNAKNHEREALIVTNAGQKGSVTIATNMAGRGTDIKLGESVKELGGLCIFGTERHEARRIDDQLRGRSGRQGDPGVSQFFISMDDDLMRIFGSDRMKSIMNALKVPEDQPIENRFISSSIEKAQAKIEGFHFDARKHVLEYDDVMNKQREYIYGKRRSILRKTKDNESLKEEMKIMMEAEATEIVNAHCLQARRDWQVNEVVETSKNMFMLEDDLTANLNELQDKNGNDEEIRKQMVKLLVEKGVERYATKEQDVGAETMRQVERFIMLRSIDVSWMQYLSTMDRVKDSVKLRGYGMRDPLIEYKKEAYMMFRRLLATIQTSAIENIFRIKVAPQAPIVPRRNLVMSSSAKSSGETKPISAASGDSKGQPASAKASAGKVGRNEPCPCGSGKKYKKCCGK